jgi:hypothetical protein
MRFGQHVTLFSAFLIVTTSSALAAPHVRRGPTAPRSVRSRSMRSTSTHASATHLTMAPERATEIQNALIKSGYLTGTPSGQWDAQSQAAMEKLQADNGWQTKLVPDSRALIKLGLGPNSAASGTHESAPSLQAGTQPGLQSGDTFAAHVSNQ